MTLNPNKTDRDDSSHRLLIVRLGALQLAVHSERVLAICDWTTPTPLPFSPDPIKGVISVDGRMFTVLEIGRLFGEKSEEVRKAIVAFRGDEQLALAVDGTQGEIEVNPRDISSTADGTARTVSGVLHKNDNQIQVLEVNELFASAIQGRERRRRRF